MPTQSTLLAVTNDAGIPCVPRRSTPSIGVSRRCVRPASNAERRRLERQVQQGNYVVPARGMFAPSQEWEQATKADQVRCIIRTLTDDHPSWVFCLFSAALAYGLDAGFDDIVPVHVCVKRNGRSKGSALVQRHTIQCASPTVVDGVMLTPAAQTVADCLCQLPFPQALALADSALRVLGLAREELYAQLGDAGDGLEGQIARWAVAWADARAANADESAARAAMIEEGFMLPEPRCFIDDPFMEEGGIWVTFAWRLADGVVMAAQLEEDDLDARAKAPNAGAAQEGQHVDPPHVERVTSRRLRLLRLTPQDVADRSRFVQMLQLLGVPRGASRHPVRYPVCAMP